MVSALPDWLGDRVVDADFVDQNAAAGVLPPKLWNDKPPPYCRHVTALQTRTDALRWLRPRVSVIFCGLVTIIAGAVIAGFLEMGLFTDGMKAIGIFFIILGTAFFSMACCLSVSELMSEERDSSIYGVGVLLFTMFWGLILGIIFVAISDEFERRMLGVGVLLMVVSFMIVLFWYVLLHTVAAYYEATDDVEDGDPSNVYSLLNIVRLEVLNSGGSDPSPWQLLGSKQFKAWLAPFGIKVFFSIVAFFFGSASKALNQEILGIAEDSVIQICSAVGEVLICLGAAGLIYTIPALWVEFLPEQLILGQLPENFPIRVRNGIAHSWVLVPVMLLNCLWMLIRGLNYNGNMAQRTAGTLLMVSACVIGLYASSRISMTVFSMRLTEHLELELASMADPGGSIDDATDASIGPQVLPQPASGDPSVDPAQDDFPPDCEMMPFPPQAFKLLPLSLWPHGLNASDARLVSRTAPWRRWWNRRLLRSSCSPFLGLASGIVSAFQHEWEEPPSAWIKLLAPMSAEICGAMCALTFLYGFFMWIHVLPQRAELEVCFHALNFLWLLIRAGHDFASEDPGVRLAGVVLVLASLFQLRRLLMGVLVVAAKVAESVPEAEKELGPPPRSFPVMRLKELLRKGNRWSVAEFRREMHRVPELKHWNRILLAQCLGCFLIALCGGLLKDDILLPTLDLAFDEKVINEDKHESLLKHFLRPAGSVLAALGATLLLQRLLAPLVEAGLWVLQSGMPRRKTCADYTTAGINSFWLVIFAAYLVPSESRQTRIAGILLLSMAIVRAGLFLTTGLLLLWTQDKPAPADLPSEIFGYVGSTDMMAIKYANERKGNGRYVGVFNHPEFGAGDIPIKVVLYTPTRGKWTISMVDELTMDITIRQVGKQIRMVDRWTQFIGEVVEDGSIHGVVVQSGTRGGRFELHPQVSAKLAADTAAKQENITDVPRGNVATDRLDADDAAWDASEEHLGVLATAPTNRMRSWTPVASPREDQAHLPPTSFGASRNALDSDHPEFKACDKPAILGDATAPTRSNADQIIKGFHWSEQGDRDRRPPPFNQRDWSQQPLAPLQLIEASQSPTHSESMDQPQDFRQITSDLPLTEEAQKVHDNSAPVPSESHDPKMLQVIAGLPFAAQLGLVQPIGSSDKANRTWKMSFLGHLMLFVSLAASAVFLLVGALLQKQWKTLSVDEDIDERIAGAAIGAMMILLTIPNGIAVSVKLCKLHGRSSFR